MLKERPRFTLEEAARIAAFIGCDGHGIYSIDFVDRMGGVPKNKVEWFDEVHQSDSSDGTGKYVIDGDPKKSMRGVYGLVLLQAACLDVGGKPEDYFGRGRQAAAAVSEIRRLAKEAGVAWPVFDGEGKEVCQPAQEQ